MATRPHGAARPARCANAASPRRLIAARPRPAARPGAACSIPIWTDSAHRTAPLTMQLLNTLYVTTPESYLRLDNDTLRVELEREVRLRVPLHHLHAVVCFGHIALSAPLMHRLAEE